MLLIFIRIRTNITFATKKKESNSNLSKILTLLSLTCQKVLSSKKIPFQWISALSALRCWCIYHPREDSPLHTKTKPFWKDPLTCLRGQRNYTSKEVFSGTLGNRETRGLYAREFLLICLLTESSQSSNIMNSHAVLDLWCEI